MAPPPLAKRPARHPGPVQPSRLPHLPRPARPHQLPERRTPRAHPPAPAREEYAALQAARAEQHTDAWKDRYKIRAGVEGTISQGVQRCGLRRSRYRGLAKTSLQHQVTGAAINLARIDAHLTETPRASTRTSPFARLRPAESELSGAN
ncbi:Transposase DDE domain-containing protein [Streptomyces sp. cf124]|nr:Transposase DDE domain-containing protein [Streptomyces sp. cf124]